MFQPFIALFNIGGERILLVLVLMSILALAAVGGLAIVYLVVRASEKDAGTTPPPPPAPPAQSAQPSNLEQQLRMLAKLRDDRVITEDDFNAKKKALLGI